MIEDIDKEFDKFEEKTFEIEKSILGIKNILNLNRKDITEDSNGLPRHITYHQEDIIRVLEILNDLEEELMNKARLIKHLDIEMSDDLTYRE